MSQKAKNNEFPFVTIQPLKNFEIEAVNQIEIESGLTPTNLSNNDSDSISSSNIYLTAKLKEQIGGFVFARLITTVVEIDQIAVALRYRRRRIGETLLRAVVEVAIQNQAAEIWLEVRESNQDAIEFYLRNDFKVVGKRKLYYSAPAEDAVLMSLQVLPAREPVDKKSKLELDAVNQLE